MRLASPMYDTPLKGSTQWCRLPIEVSEPEWAEALKTGFQAQAGAFDGCVHGEGVPVQARRLAQTAQPQLGVSNVSTDLSCDGCAKSDTRTQVKRAPKQPCSPACNCDLRQL